MINPRFWRKFPTSLAGWLAWVLLLITVTGKAWFEQTMTRQMLLHIPLIALAGWGLGRQLSGLGARLAVSSPLWRAAARLGADMNAHGAPGLLYATLVGMYWMIPKALDDVLLHAWVATGKFASVLLAGLVLQASWRRAHPVIRVFFLGGFCWASAIAGMLYQEHTERLCNFYLLDDQVWAGRGLVILAVLLPAAWALTEAINHRRRLRQSGTTSSPRNS